jgi:hypothetical protein
MGLDMYLSGDKYFVPDYKTLQAEYEAGKERPGPSEARTLGKPVDADGEAISSSQHELGYWRKFAPLHEYIVETFANGVDECQRIDLDGDDLEMIAVALTDDALPSNDNCGGFLFGSGEGWDEYRAEAAHHADKIRAAAQWLEASPLHPSGSHAQWRSVHYQASW